MGNIVVCVEVNLGGGGGITYSFGHNCLFIWLWHNISRKFYASRISQVEAHLKGSEAQWSNPLFEKSD